MSAVGKCIVCGEPIPPVLVGGEQRGHCMHIDLLEWHPSQFIRKTTYTGLWVCHDCAKTITANIAQNDSDFGIDG